MDLKVEIIPEAIGKVTLPKYQTSGSAGFDIEAFIPEGSVGISAVGTIVRTGLKFDIPKGYELQIRPRSGLAFKHNITLVNSPATVDSDYTGEVLIKLINLVPTSHDFMIENGTRIAQGVLQPVIQANIISGVVDKETDRGEGGFGSTGINKKDTPLLIIMDDILHEYHPNGDVIRTPIPKDRPAPKARTVTINPNGCGVSNREGYVFTDTADMNGKTNTTPIHRFVDVDWSIIPRKHKKVLILGAARSGKDTLGMILQKNFGLRFKSSSEFANEKVIFPILSKVYRYKTLKECFEDRVNHRSEWFNLIQDYNSEDPARLTKQILKENDIYCGMRSYREFYHTVTGNLFDEYIWLDREGCGEPNDSFNITSKSFYEMTIGKSARIIKNNFNTVEEFESFIVEKFKGVFSDRS